MKYMRAAEIREAFLSFYEKHGHFREKSSSLIPINDPTLLFTSAGMVQFKDVFTGIEKRSYTRATTAQRCLRAGGKHNDLENVGFTGRHQTFFEMLGNFSFGDYFKKEAIHYAWDFVTNVLKLPKEHLYVTIHINDEEAFRIWTEQEKVPAERIYRFDKDNFWSAGDVGPCGPCTEIFFDRGEKYNTGDPKKDCMGGDGDRFLEFYNIVFMQYERNEQGEMNPLPKPSVDTGMGLERITSIIQDVNSNYETDLFLPIIAAIKKLSKIENPDRVATQVIADHLRAVAFLIADGLLPGNEGRGYVLRRILRRAIRFGKKIGFEKPFLCELLSTLVQEMAGAFPLLKEKEEFIYKAMRSEEEKFFSTLEHGLALLHTEISKLSKGGTLPGKTAFLLYDSFGFPLDLTEVILKEHGLNVDESGFQEAMEKQKAQSKQQENEKNTANLGLYQELAQKNLATKFIGYDHLEAKGKALAIIFEGEFTETIVAKTEEVRGEIIWDKSPFYTEGGGQVGDTGEIFQEKNSRWKPVAKIINVTKPWADISVADVEVYVGQSLELNQEYLLRVSGKTRKATAANHSATHLLHWALRATIGDHVKQAGSLVNDKFLRFDFTHFQALTAEELIRIEDMVNKKIAEANAVEASIMSKDDAISAGAIALFGEKYGSEVRVLKMGEYSTELCGGTHVSNTSEIRIFKIISEAGIAAGIRRITALTAQTAYEYLSEKAKAMDTLLSYFKAQSEKEILERVDKTQNNLKEMEKKIEKLEARLASQEITSILSSIKNISGIPFLSYEMDGDAKKVRLWAEMLRQKIPEGIIALGSNDEGKAILFVSVSKEFTNKVHAGKIIQNIAPLIQGKGGGKADSAQAGGTNPAALREALEKIPSFIN